MMNETTFIAISDTDLGSRHAAAKLRVQVEACALDGKKVVLNLGSVLSISESYADELFGVLVARHGLEWFAERIALHGATPVVFRVIVTSIRYRLEAESPDTPDVALLAAQKALRERHRSAA
jgi:hypothetical protein